MIPLRKRALKWHMRMANDKKGKKYVKCHSQNLLESNWFISRKWHMTMAHDKKGEKICQVPVLIITWNLTSYSY